MGLVPVGWLPGGELALSGQPCGRNVMWILGPDGSIRRLPPEAASGSVRAVEPVPPPLLLADPIESEAPA